MRNYDSTAYYYSKSILSFRRLAATLKEVSKLNKKLSVPSYEWDIKKED